MRLSQELNTPDASKDGRYATITKIQRLSLDDGPGIRSTVFFKGCSLACLWCHNPENISAASQIQFIYARCTCCGACINECPAHCCNVDGGKREIVFSECTGCGACVAQCVFNAVELLGEQKTVDDLVKILVKDKAFYDTSGGGVTLSGGEPLLKPDFCAELISMLKQEGVQTVVDTCGAVAWSSFEKVLPFTDMFLYDVKAWDVKVHQRLTGSPNGKILDNLKALDEAGKRIVIRMPLIKNENDGIEDLVQTAQFISKLSNVELIELLPYHTYGVGKYDGLGIPYLGKSFVPPDDTHLESISEILSGVGKTVRIKHT